MALVTWDVRTFSTVSSMQRQIEGILPLFGNTCLITLGISEALLQSTPPPPKKCSWSAILQYSSFCKCALCLLEITIFFCEKNSKIIRTPSTALQQFKLNVYLEIHFDKKIYDKKDLLIEMKIYIHPSRQYVYKETRFQFNYFIGNANNLSLFILYSPGNYQLKIK